MGQIRRGCLYYDIIFFPLLSYFLAMTQPFMARIIYGNSGLIMRNSSYDDCFIFVIFCIIFCGEMGVANTRTPNGQEPSNPSKILAHLGALHLLGSLLFRNNIFEFFFNNVWPSSNFHIQQKDWPNNYIIHIHDELRTEEAISQ